MLFFWSPYHTRDIEHKILQTSWGGTINQDRDLRNNVLIKAVQLYLDEKKIEYRNANLQLMSTKQESSSIWSDSDDDGENTPAGKLKRFKVARKPPKHRWSCISAVGKPLVELMVTEHENDKGEKAEKTPALTPTQTPTQTPTLTPTLSLSLALALALALTLTLTLSLSLTLRRRRRPWSFTCISSGAPRRGRSMTSSRRATRDSNRSPSPHPSPDRNPNPVPIHVPGPKQESYKWYIGELKKQEDNSRSLYALSLTLTLTPTLTPTLTLT